MQVASVEDTIERITTRPGVTGVVVTTRDGIPIRTTLDNTATVIYTGAMAAIEERATSLIRDMDPTNELLSLRVQTRKFEVMLKTNPEYMVLILQKCKEMKRGGIYSF